MSSPFFRNNKFQQLTFCFETISPKLINHLSTFSAPRVITEDSWANVSPLYIVNCLHLASDISLFINYYPVSKSMLHISVSILLISTSLINRVLHGYSWLWMNRSENNYKANVSHHSWSIFKSDYPFLFWLSSTAK